MSIPSLTSCARRYAETWSRGERPIFEGLASDDRVDRLHALQKGAGYFRIARSFHKKFDVGRGLERFAPVLDVLEPLRTSKLGMDTMCSTVAALRVKLGRDYGGVDLLSAATKLLWLLRRNPAIIYDSRARFALGTPLGNYEKYVELWQRGYRASRSEIHDASAALPSRVLKRIPCSRGEAPEWFHQRVYDIYLWSAGARRRRVSAG